MAQVYIINKATFEDYEDVSVNIEPKRMNVFIKKAQELDLKLFMGDVFYYDMLRQSYDSATGEFKDTAPQIYKDLINGCDYEDNQGNYMYNPGIIPALVYFTFARFVEADGIHYTATGPVTKLRDDSESLKMGDLTKLVQQHRSVANAHLNDVIKFLNTKRAEYKFWKYSERNANSRQPGPRIRGIDATQVRGAAYGFDNNIFPSFNNFIP